jgi:hypothetical protein
MKRLLKSFFLALLFVSVCGAQQSFRYRCPKVGRVLPSSCLEGMKIANSRQQLNSVQRHQLVYLLAKSFVVSIVKYQQDYPIGEGSPISRLIIANFPETGSLVKEGGIWLRDLFYFFRSQSQYKPDVEKSVRELPLTQRRRFAREHAAQRQ